MANPFSAIKDAVIAELLTFPGIDHAESYDGQEFESLGNLVARQPGAGRAWVRVSGGERDIERGGVQSDIRVQIFLGCTSLRGRATAAEAADDQLWTVLDNIENSKCALTWLFMGLQYRDFLRVHQTKQTVVTSLIMSTRFDMATWTA